MVVAIIFAAPVATVIRIVGFALMVLVLLRFYSSVSAAAAGKVVFDVTVVVFEGVSVCWWCGMW